MKSVAFAVEDRSPRGIAGAIARLISSGDLAPGDRLPTVRELAADLGVSPATVSHAWQALAGVGPRHLARARGHVRARRPRAAGCPRRSRPRPAPPPARLDLSTRHPRPAPAPRPRAGARRGSRAGRRRRSYHDEPVIPELATLLRRSWPFDPAERSRSWTAPSTRSPRRSSRRCRFGDRVVVENPGFPPFFDLLDHSASSRLPVELDEEGMRPDAARRGARRSPRRHRPAAARAEPDRGLDDGRARRAARRVIRVGRNADRTVVVEDDHSGEISIGADVSLGAFLPDRVVHVRSFSKSHGPDLRIARARRAGGQLVDRRGRPAHARPRLDLAHAADDPARPAHRLVTVGQSSEARRIYHARQRALAEALAAHGCRRRRPTASTSGCRSPTSGRRSWSWRHPASGSRAGRRSSPQTAPGRSSGLPRGHCPMMCCRSRGRSPPQPGREHPAPTR